MKKTKVNKKKVIVCFCFITLLMYTFIKHWHTMPLTIPVSTNNPYAEVSYYRKELLERYKAYHILTNTLSIEDIVTHVNMGIDQGFYKAPPQVIEHPDSINVLVNKFYKLPETWNPSDLVIVNPNREQSLNVRAAEAFFDFQKACQEEGFTISAYSGYRSTTYQNEIYHNMILAHGQEYTDTYVARPGQSEHATGLCVDISIDGIYYEDIEGSPHYPWFKEHLSTYGFILRYPKDKETVTGYSHEAWHIRYLGEELAKKVTDSGLTYDEYIARQ